MIIFKLNNIIFLLKRYLWGTIVDYIVSYLRLNGEPNLDSSVGGAVFPFMMLSIAGGMFIAVPGLEYIKNSKIYYGIGNKFQE